MNVEVSFLLFFTKSWHGNVMCVSSQFFHPKWHQALPGERQINITDKTPQTSMISHSCYNKERSVFGKKQALQWPKRSPQGSQTFLTCKISETFHDFSITINEISIIFHFLRDTHIWHFTCTVPCYQPVWYFGNLSCTCTKNANTHTHSDSPAPSLLQQLLDEQEGGSAKTIKLQFLTLICTIWKWWGE